MNSISFVISKPPILSLQAPQVFYLPPGWTLERLQTATVDDLRQIPEDRLHEIDENLIPIENVPVQLVIGREIHNEHRRKVRAERGLPPAPGVPLFEKNDDSVVEVVERGGFDDFGFIVFRTDYSDEQRWEQWHKEFQRIIDAPIERASGGKKIEDKCFMPTYEDEDMAGATHEQILQEYPGYFRVAVESVITELYPMLSAMTPSVLWPSDNRIWESAVE
ncbi:hypothetical protein N7501_003251 [Penicillium viridicatum]|nr:hypothetical protein N7501_003251 [Penicillium viridicatum]